MLCLDAVRLIAREDATCSLQKSSRPQPFRPASADFASGDFRARLFRQGAYIWNNHWFGGHTLPGYGIVSPMLGMPLGVIPVAIASLILASWAFGSIVVHYKSVQPALPSPTLAAMLFALGCGLSLWGGRITFGPAVAFGALCVICLQRRRPVGAESLTVFAPRVGITTVRFRYTKWYQIASGDACLTRSTDGLGATTRTHTLNRCREDLVHT